MCPPDSLHDRCLVQFPWVRSYVKQDGNLFLATMADGSIIEFEPAPLAATVYGEKIRTADTEEMQARVLTPQIFQLTVGKYMIFSSIT